MHDQSASRISGRTLAAVAAMSVRALRIVVLKSAGNSPATNSMIQVRRNFQCVTCFTFTRYGICCVPAIFERRRGRPGSKISGRGQLAEVAAYFKCGNLPAQACLLPRSCAFGLTRKEKASAGI